ncbi:MAG: molybdenum cofactor guanylyltransferase [Planctomycetes bacterium]|nr:molybdenum cofactor guanylyltransferase [Planctomycetota bacterium]
MNIAGIVLCGGPSKRMGQPKAWLPIGDELMLPRIVRIVGECVAPIVVVAAPTQELPPLPGQVRIARDLVTGRGPLQGLATGLSTLPKEIDAVYLTACDVPFVKPAFIQRVIELLGNHQIAVPEIDGYQHPLAAVYRRDVLDAAEKLLAENRLRPVFLFETCSTRIVRREEIESIDPGLRSLRNVNTPEEYAETLKTHGD